MKINGVAWRTLWPEPDGAVGIIDQTLLPHRFETRRLVAWQDAAQAIAQMWVRGAPLIGATAAHGVALAMAEDPSDAHLAMVRDRLWATRPTAVNLAWALDRVGTALARVAPADRAARARALAAELCDEDVAINAAIGEVGLDLIRRIHDRTGAPVRILTHCNAGWLATVDWGTATAPIYKAHDAGIPVSVWVDETRPRNQGAFLTAWELANHGVPHRVVVDNAGGHLMQHGLVDLCIVGSDRTTATGDVCNKIGTYLKALAAHANGVPFYVALPSPTIDFDLTDGLRDIPIEERSAEEVTHIQGLDDGGVLRRVRLTPQASDAANYGFDVTPAHLVTGLITERGLTPASRDGIAALFPDRAA